MSAAAPLRRRVLRQAGFETLTLLRNGEQLLVAVVLPVAVLVGLVVADGIDLGAGRRVDLATPGVLALCVLSSAFTAQAIATGFDRRYGVLRLLGVSPLGRPGLLAAKAMSVLVVLVVQVTVVAVVAAGLGWEPALEGLPAAVVSVVLGTWAFVALALLLAGTIRAEAVLAVANLVWVALLALGGVVVARSELPDGLADVVRWLPSAALGDAVRAALVDGAASPAAWGVLLAWAVVASALAGRLFRWSD